MRELSLHEITSISGAGKKLVDYSFADTLPVIASYFGFSYGHDIAANLGERAGSYLGETLAPYFITSMGGLGAIAGAVGAYAAVSFANKKVIEPYVAN